MSGYYPESYLRKRQREQGVRRLIIGAVALAIIALVGIPVSIFASRHFAAMRSDAKDGPALAREKQELEQQRKIDSAPDQQWAAAAAGAGNEADKAPRLADLQYAASFPQLSVGLEGAAPAGTAPATDIPVSDGGTELGAPALEALADAPASGDSAVDPDPVTSLQPGGVAKAPAPGGADALPAAGVDDKYTRKADDDQKKKDAAKLLAKEKAEREKARQAAKDKQEAKDKQAAKDKAAAKAKQAEKDKQARDEQAAKDADKPSKPKAGDAVMLLVYAGSFGSRDDAEAAKKSLDNLGLSGSLISDDSGHRLLIMSTEDYKSANALLNKLHSSGFGAAYMTRKRK